MKRTIFHPKLLTTIKEYSASLFLSDLTAGIIVGIVALPLAIAFGIASGVTPQQGLITAIIAGLIISLLGGSRIQIGGPTGAFIVIVYGVVQKFGVSGLMTATFIAGILLILMGLFRLGTWIKFIPTSVITGFTSGIAIVIFSSQIPSFLGLNLHKIPVNFFEKWGVYLTSLSDINPWAAGMALATIFIILSMAHITPKIPGAFIALISTSAAAFFFDLPVDTIGSKFGSLSFNFPTPELPALDLGSIQLLMIPAISIALLGAIESLLSAVVADGMIGGRHRSNTELIAQGIANLVSPLFGGIPATGAIARTATNARSGGRTPIAGIIHAITLLLIVLFFGEYAAHIPMATLAGILVIVSYNMSEWRHFKALLKSPKADIAVLLITFSLTVVIDLVVAIQVGMILSTFLFMSKMSDASNISCHCTDKIADKDEYFSRPDALSKFEIPENVIIFEVKGAFFFGAAAKFEDMLLQSEHSCDTIILRMNQLCLLDATGIKVLSNLIQNLKNHDINLKVCELNESCMHAIKKSNLYDIIGENNFAPTLVMSISQITTSA
ncbi:MAG: STAS domain-containing protein [Bacteriovoracaceae bacterium]|nr:STAS domain-containing protein [Bacteriovoracaceae bacterium]